MIKTMKPRLLLLFALCFSLSLHAQESEEYFPEDDTTIIDETPRIRKYPSRLWEISGNGLKQPSYLYGTMHVSKKLAFNLGDTFYRALNSVDVIALELSIDSWLSNIGQNMDQYNYNPFGFNGFGNDLGGYGNFYKSALKFDGTDLAALLYELRSEDYMSNFLLYRQGYQSPDFSEKTYVDLYIHQVGKKLGKSCTGLEDFEISQRMVDRSDWRERKWPREQGYEGFGSYGYGESTVETAYREGDLDLIDSFEKKGADVHFLKWMLYERNKIMADNIERIVQNKRLFAAVGCAHLPGDSGVIEFLRRKGYTLTPVYDNVGEYAFKQKQKLESTNSDVVFKKFTSHTGELSFELPGTPVDRSLKNSEDIFYADVANGAYYVIKKLPYYGVPNGLTQEKLLFQLDSALYENIPGDITERAKVTINGYPALDVSNRTKTGETQRHMYILAPNHVWYIKLNAPGAYAEGKEARQFFKSIALQSPKTNWQYYHPETGGYKLYWPANVVNNPFTFDTSTNLKGHRNLEFTDEKKNFFFLRTITLPSYSHDHDTFHMHQIMENYAYYNKGKIEKLEFAKIQGHDALVASIKLKEKDLYMHCLLAVDADVLFNMGVFTSDKKIPQDFLSKFEFTAYRYKYKPVVKFDSSLKLSYARPEWAETEKEYRIFREEQTIAQKEIRYPESNFGYSSLSDYFQDSLKGEYKYANPIAFPTGENVSLQIVRDGSMAIYSNFKTFRDQRVLTEKGFDYKRYKFVQDSIKNYYDSISNSYNKVTYRNTLEPTELRDTIWFDGTHVIEVSETTYPGSSLVVYNKSIRGEYFQYSIYTTYDAKRGMSEVVKTSIESIQPEVYNPRILDSNAIGNMMVSLLSSSDSIDLFRAADYSFYLSRTPVNFNDTLFSILKKMDKNTLYGKNYVGNIESKLIGDNYLPLIGFYMDKYRRGGDTSEIQAAMLANLGRLRNKEALDSLLFWLLEETPLEPENASNSYVFTSIINTAYDSLELWKNHYKKLLPLNRYHEYEDAIMSLGLRMLDSNLIDSAVFAVMVDDLVLSFRDDLKRKLSKAAQNSWSYGYGYGYNSYDDSRSGGYYGYSDDENYEYGTYRNWLFTSNAAYDYGYSDYDYSMSYGGSGSLAAHALRNTQSFYPSYGSYGNSYEYNYGGYQSGNTLYDKARILVRFYKQNADIPKRLNKVYKLQDDAEKMQFINLFLKHKIAMPDTMYRHYLKNMETQYGFVQMLKDRKYTDSIPKNFFTEKDMVTSFVNYRHFTKKDTVVFLARKVVDFEGEKGAMYFWKHRDKESKAKEKDQEWMYSVIWIGEKDTFNTMKAPRYYHFDQKWSKKLSAKDMMNNEIAELYYWKHDLWQPLAPEEEYNYGYDGGWEFR